MTSNQKNNLVSQLELAMELYWLNQAKKQNLLTIEEYFKLKNDLLNKKRG